MAFIGVEKDHFPEEMGYSAQEHHNSFSGGVEDGSARQDAAPAVPPPNIDVTALNPAALDFILDLTDEIPEGIDLTPPNPIQNPGVNQHPIENFSRQEKKGFFKKANTPAGVKTKGKRVKIDGTCERIFTEAFVIDSVMIKQTKDIERYIKTKTEALLKVIGRSTDDFYFAYVLNGKGVLSFISTVSDRHLSGLVSVFAPAFVNEGRYVYKHKESETPIYYYIVNEGGRVSCERVSDERAGYQSLSLHSALEDKLPGSLLFKWSLEKPVKRLNYILAAMLTIIVVAYGFSLTQYNDAKDAALKSASNAPVNKPTQRGLPNVFGPIWEIAAKIGGNGLIDLVSLAPDGQFLNFRIIFARAVDSTGFIAQNGGTLDQNGTVNLTVPVKPRQ